MSKKAQSGVESPSRSNSTLHSSSTIASIPPRTFTEKDRTTDQNPSTEHSNQRHQHVVQHVFAEDALISELAPPSPSQQPHGASQIQPQPSSSTAASSPDQNTQPSQPPPRPSRKAKYWDLWMKNWFLLGLLIVIILARYFPSAGKTGGPIRPEYSVKYGVTSCIFLLSGLSLQTKEILKSAMNYRAHLITQLTSFIIIPLFVKALTSLVGLSPLNSTLLAGMCVTSATPTTISSNVVMTANSDGNESLALFNAALGNLLGVFLSPVIVLILLHSTPDSPSGKNGLDYAAILQDLGTTILIPIVVGQICLYLFPRPIAWAKRKVHFPTLNSTCLLILVWSVFCDAFNDHTFSAVSAGEIIAVGALQAFTFWSATFFLGCISRFRPRKLRVLKIMEQHQLEEQAREAQLEEGQGCSSMDTLEMTDPQHPHPCTDGLSLPRTRLQRAFEPISKADTVAILFCGGTKSVANGIPLIKIMYSSNTGGSAALAGLLATPLLIYHVEQLFSGAFMVGWLKKWVNRGEETLSSFEAKQGKTTAAPETLSEPQEQKMDVDRSSLASMPDKER